MTIPPAGRYGRRRQISCGLMIAKSDSTSSDGVCMNLVGHWPSGMSPSGRRAAYSLDEFLAGWTASSWMQEGPRTEGGVARRLGPRRPQTALPVAAYLGPLALRRRAAILHENVVLPSRCRRMAGPGPRGGSYDSSSLRMRYVELNSQPSLHRPHRVANTGRTPPD